MNARLDWGDFATVLAIAEAGSLAAAARCSEQSRPTLMRRLNAIEQRLGARLFDRFRTGYVPTASGRAMIEAARAIGSVATDAERRVADRDRRPAGKVVLTTTDTLYTALLAPELSSFHAKFPDIMLEVRVSNRIQDLFHREADVALRPDSAPEQSLVGRKLGVIRQAIYTSWGYGAARLDEMASVGPADDFPYPALHSAMSATGLLPRCAVRLNSILSMFEAVRAGAGAGILPVYLGDSDPALQRHGAPIRELETDLWLLADPELRTTARVRAVLDHLGARPTLRAKLR